MFGKKELVMGFGHRVYKYAFLFLIRDERFHVFIFINRNGDPRSPIIKKWSQKLSEEKGGNKVLFDVSERVEKV